MFNIDRANLLFPSPLFLRRLGLNVNLSLNVDIHRFNSRSTGGTIGNQASLTLNIIPSNRILELRCDIYSRSKRWHPIPSTRVFSMIIYSSWHRNSRMVESLTIHQAQILHSMLFYLVFPYGGAKSSGLAEFLGLWEVLLRILSHGLILFGGHLGL
jgi:hypothetical protein